MREEKLFTVSRVIRCALIFTALTLMPAFSNSLLASDDIKLRFSTKWPATSPFMKICYGPILEEIKEKSNGRIDYEVYASGALARPTEAYDAVRTGKADIAEFTTGYTPGRFPLTDVLSLPITFPDTKTVVEVSSAVFDRILKQEYKDTHTFVIWRVENFIYFGTKEVRTLEDLKGLKIRTPGGIITKVLKKLGATPITMGIPDVYLSMKTGVIDGCLTGYSAIIPFKLQEVVKYVLRFSFGATTDGMIMNKAAWERLPDDLKPVVEAAGRKGGIRMALMSDGGRAKFKKALADAGAKTYSLSPEEYKRWNSILKAVADEWVADMKAKGLPGEKALTIFREETRKKGVDFPF